jgi:16S rRNA (cytosine1402-N4)-methyltransferase
VNDSPNDPAARPPRRKRYRGSHPRSFAEKYKELDPARFPEEAARVRARGQTPAGSHVPVLLEEVLDVLRLEPGDVVLDATLGHGGHAEAMAAHIGPGGILLGLDVDAEELGRTAERLSARGIAVRARHANFAGAGKALAAEGIDAVDALLADLGASSMQLDDPRRGFSYRRAGPLDMRLDRHRGPTAVEWLRGASEEEVARALAYCDEPDTERMARALKAAADEKGLGLDTAGLMKAVLAARGLTGRPRLRSAFDRHLAARVFQALRAAVNREEENLKALLRDLPYILRPGARAAIITFHGGEDALVKAAFTEGHSIGLYALAGDPLPPRVGEIQSNPRSRSARLRWVERAGEGKPAT